MLYPLSCLFIYLSSFVLSCFCNKYKQTLTFLARKKSVFKMAAPPGLIIFPSRNGSLHCFTSVRLLATQQFKN